MERNETAAKYHIAIVLCFIWMLLLSACGKAQEKQLEFDELQVVRVECGDQSGSGVVYAASEEAVVVITAAHALDEAEKVTVVWKAEKDENDTAPDTISKVKGLDLAFLKIEGATLREVAVDESDNHDEKQVILRGYDAVGKMQETEGVVWEDWIYVEDFGCHMMVVKAETVPGMSGGGAFYVNGELAGIICGKDEAGNVAILPTSVISAEYDVIFGK